MKNLKKCKSRSYDDLSAELIQTGREASTHTMHEDLEQQCKAQSMDGINLHSNPNKKEIITLISHNSKILLQIIMKRILKMLNPNYKKQIKFSPDDMLMYHYAGQSESIVSLTLILFLDILSAF